MRRPGEPLELHVLRRRLHYDPAVGFLQLLRMHRIVLDWCRLCDRVSRHNVQQVRRSGWVVFPARRKPARALHAVSTPQERAASTGIAREGRRHPSAAVSGLRVRMSAENLEWAMFFLALLMLPVVLIEFTAEDPQVLFAAEVANGLIWLAFASELVFLWRRSATSKSFLRAHWLDLAIVLLSPPFFVPPEL